MRKLSLLLGTLGGAMAGYIFSNKKLRQELVNAKDGSAAAKILGKHLSTDGHQVAKEAKQFAREHHLDDKIADGKQYAKKYYQSSKKEVEKFLSKGAKEAAELVKAAKRKLAWKK